MEIFRTLCVEVLCCSDMDEVLSMFATGKTFDLILTDLSIPGIGRNGQLLDFLKTKISEQTRLVVISGNPDLAEIAKSRGLKFLKKPIDLSDLQNLIRPS